MRLCVLRVVCCDVCVVFCVLCVCVVLFVVWFPLCVVCGLLLLLGGCCVSVDVRWL